MQAVLKTVPRFSPALVLLAVLSVAMLWLRAASAVHLSQESDVSTLANEYRAGAVLGNRAAQFNLGVLYVQGRGVPRDDAAAAKLWRLAGLQGHAAAQLDLAELYAQGRGVPHDDAQAATWYHAAAEEGAGTAQYELGLLYYRGTGVRRDFSQACFWFSLAARSGNKDMARWRDIAAEQLSLAAFEAVQQRLVRWRPNHVPVVTVAGPERHI